jgi:hypothetical protein
MAAYSRSGLVVVLIVVLASVPTAASRGVERRGERQQRAEEHR